ncbi:MAG: ECF-type sigma factor [Pseudomonadota bacterium]
MADTSDIDALLKAVKSGDNAAVDALYRLVYDELHKLAAAQRRRWGGNHTIGTTALVHEAYLKLGDGKGQDWEGRRHFFGTASMAMRHVLVSYARAAQADKRGGGMPAVEMDLELVADPVIMSDVLALHDALERLEALESRWARVVECRVFAGMSINERPMRLASRRPPSSVTGPSRRRGCSESCVPPRAPLAPREAQPVRASGILP